jgi:hypothetical protein
MLFRCFGVRVLVEVVDFWLECYQVPSRSMQGQWKRLVLGTLEHVGSRDLGDVVKIEFVGRPHGYGS